MTLKEGQTLFLLFSTSLSRTQAPTYTLVNYGLKTIREQCNSRIFIVTYTSYIRFFAVNAKRWMIEYIGEGTMIQSSRQSSGSRCNVRQLEAIKLCARRVACVFACATVDKLSQHALRITP